MIRPVRRAQPNGDCHDCHPCSQGRPASTTEQPLL
jgi:hypothetical protein